MMMTIMAWVPFALSECWDLLFERDAHFNPKDLNGGKHEDVGGCNAICCVCCEGS